MRGLCAEKMFNFFLVPIFFLAPMAARRGGYPYRGSAGPLAGRILGSKAAAQVELAASQSCSGKRVAGVAPAMYYVPLRIGALGGSKERLSKTHSFETNLAICSAIGSRAVPMACWKAKMNVKCFAGWVVRQLCASQLWVCSIL